VADLRDKLIVDVEEAIANLKLVGETAKASMGDQGAAAAKKMADGVKELQRKLDDLRAESALDKIGKSSDKMASALDQAAAAGRRVGLELTGVGTKAKQAQTSTRLLGNVSIIAADAMLSLGQRALGAAKSIGVFLSEGEDALRIQSAFRGELDVLRAASGDIITDTTLQKLDSLARGAEASAAEIEALTTAAAILESRGITPAEEAMKAFIEGEEVAVKLADQLGIEIDKSSAAFQGMSDAQKRVAVMQDIAAGAMSLSSDEIDRNATAVQRAEVQYDNMVSAIQVYAAESFAASGATETLSETVAQLNDMLGDNEEGIVDVTAASIAWLVESNPLVVMINGISAALDILNPILEVGADLGLELGGVMEGIGIAFEFVAVTANPIPAALIAVNDAVNDGGDVIPPYTLGLGAMNVAIAQLATVSQSAAAHFSALANVQAAAAGKKFVPALTGDVHEGSKAWRDKSRAEREAKQTLDELSGAFGRLSGPLIKAIGNVDGMKNSWEKLGDKGKKASKTIKDVSDSVRALRWAAEDAAQVFGELPNIVGLGTLAFLGVDHALVQMIESSLPRAIEGFQDLQDVIAGAAGFTLGEESIGERIAKEQAILAEGAALIKEDLSSVGSDVTAFVDSSGLDLDRGLESWMRWADGMQTASLDVQDAFAAVQEAAAQRDAALDPSKSAAERVKAAKAASKADKDAAKSGIAAGKALAISVVDDTRTQAGILGAFEVGASLASYPDPVGMATHALAAAQYFAVAGGGGGGGGAPSSGGGGGGSTPASSALSAEADEQAEVVPEIRINLDTIPIPDATSRQLFDSIERENVLRGLGGE